MRTFVQVFVDAVEVRVSLWRRETMIWSVTESMEATTPLEQGLVRLLSLVPRRRWTARPRVIFSFGAHLSRIKRIRGLPAVQSPYMLEAIIRENARQFYLWEVPFVTTEILPLEPGEVLGGILDAALVDTCVEACASAGFSIRGIHPDGDSRLIYRPTRVNVRTATVSPYRTVVAWGLACTAIIAAGIAPALAARQSIYESMRELEALAPQIQRSSHQSRVIKHDNDALLQIEEFEHSRSSATLLLAAITDALPTQSAISTFRIDTTALDVVVVSARAAEILAVFERVPGVIMSEIVGPVSREGQGSEELERVTIRLRYDGSTFSEAARTSYHSRHKPIVQNDADGRVPGLPMRQTTEFTQK